MDEFDGFGLMPRVDVLTDPHCISGALAEQHLDEAIAIGAQDASLNVVMDACPKNRITASRRGVTDTVPQTDPTFARLLSCQSFTSGRWIGRSISDSHGVVMHFRAVRTAAMAAQDSHQTDDEGIHPPASSPPA